MKNFSNLEEKNLWLKKKQSKKIWNFAFIKKFKISSKIERNVKFCLKMLQKLFVNPKLSFKTKFFNLSKIETFLPRWRNFVGKPAKIFYSWAAKPKNSDEKISYDAKTKHTRGNVHNATIYFCCVVRESSLSLITSEKTPGDLSTSCVCRAWRCCRCC